MTSDKTTTPRADRSRSRSSDMLTPPMPESMSGGRYKLVRPLGRGGFGAVYEGIDQLTGQPVAVKLMGEEYGKELSYRWREAALLRLLQLPGVVQLIEEGQDGDTTYLVMELVQGEPFPGYAARGDWTKVEAPLRQLLSTLERVHLEGIVHRDLKPHNVLVREDGSVVLLDFGLSLDPNLAASLTSTPSRIVGTPAYLAPEQWRSEPVSRQTDLWAVGIMLYEALCGELPFRSSSMLETMRDALAADLRVERIPSDVPPHVVWFLRRLLAASPHDRPTSAGDALRLLDGEGSASQRHMMPLLGRQDALDAALGHLLDGRAVCFSGPPGSGRTRMIQEVREALGRLGRFTLRLWPADEPYMSLRELGLRGDEARVQLDAALDEGMIVLCEELEGLDPATRALLTARLPGYPALIARAPRPLALTTIPLAPLEPHTLLRLFGGHERIVRMRSGGAHELFRRTGGNAAKVAREVEGWTRAKLARWHGDLLVLEADALPKLRAGLQLSEATAQRPDDTLEERIQAWLYLTQPVADSALLSDLLSADQAEVEQHLSALVERGHIQRDAQGEVFVHKAAWMDDILPPDAKESAHLSIAAALPAGHPKRLYHMVAAGHASSLVDELLAQALAWDAQGMVSRALVTLSDAVKQARAQRPPLDDTPLLLAAARIALASGTKRDLERLLYELEGARKPTYMIELCARLVQVALQIIQRGDKEDLDALDDIGFIFDDPELELRRSQWRVRVSWRLPMEVLDEVLDELRDWSEAAQDANIEGSYLGWLGMQRYRQQRFEEAAALHARSASLKTRPTARASSLLNATLAYSHALSLDEALRHAELTQDAARACEHHHYETNAALLIRHIRYQLGAALDPDPELLEVASRLLDPSSVAAALIIEAANAMRCDRRDEALTYTQRAMNIASNGIREPLLLAVCLRHALTHEPPANLDALVQDIIGLPRQRIAAQALGLLAQCTPLPDAALDLLRAHPAYIPAAHLHTRLETISIAEALAHAGLAPDGPRLTLPTTP